MQRRNRTTKLWSIFLRFWVEQEVHKPRVERRRPEYVVGGMACQGEVGSNGQPDEAARSSLHLAISPTCANPIGRAKKSCSILRFGLCENVKPHTTQTQHYTTHTNNRTKKTGQEDLAHLSLAPAGLVFAASAACPLHFRHARPPRSIVPKHAQGRRPLQPVAWPCPHPSPQWRQRESWQRQL